MKYLSKIEMFEITWLGNIFKAMGAIPVDRGAPDRKALHDCLRVINAGFPLVMFPEGGRRDGPVVQPLQDGVAYLALKANIPIVTVGIAGSEEAQPRGRKAIKPVKLRIVINKPFLLEQSEAGRASRAAITAGTTKVAHELQKSFDEALAL